MDDELLDVARTAIGSQFGLTPEQSRRLRGDTARALRHDAQAMRRELGLDPAVDEGAPRDERGRYRSSENVAVNVALRRASGR